jgi:hypothetical protein
MQPKPLGLNGDRPPAVIVKSFFSSEPLDDSLL